MPSSPQTYTISDFIEWHSKKQLVLAPDFQRGSVWSPSAKVFLIDTLLNDLPIPQVYFRTKIDSISQTMLREVVDGQQRLRAILEFAADRIKLTSKAPKHKGKVYSTLSAEDKEVFLAYKVPAVQLINATDADVLEVFARLNSYSVKVTPAELRHAEFSEPVKWAIYDASRDWAMLWNQLRIVSVRDSVRLKNTSLIAELFMSLDRGLDDGGETTITKYYNSRKKQDESYFTDFRSTIDQIINEIIDELSEDYKGTTFFDAPNFLILFSALAYLKGYLKDSRITEGVETHKGLGVNWEHGKTVLAEISQAVENTDDEHPNFSGFVAATRSTTHRLSSRKPRFQTLVRALSQDDAP